MSEAEALRTIVGYLGYPLMLLTGFLALMALQRFLPMKGIWRRVLLVALLGYVNGITIWLGDPYNILISLVIFIPAICLLCGGTLLARLSVGIIFFSLSISASAVFSQVRPPFDFLRMVYSLLLWLAVFLVVRRALPLHKVQTIRSPKLWLLLDALSAMPFFSTLAIVALTRPMLVEPEADAFTGQMMTQNEGVLLTVLALATASSLAVLLAAVLLARHETLENEQLLWQVRSQYYAGTEENQRQVRRLRHDMANHLQTMAGMDDAAMRAYLSGLIHSPAMDGGKRWCEHEVVNAVLAAKAPQAQEEGMRLEVNVTLPRQLAMADIDLCALFANCLDNAMEACRGLPPEKRHITLRARADKGLLVLQAENAMAGSLIMKNGKPQTSKADATNHGLGLAGIRDIAQRYNGTVQVGQYGQTFRLLFSVPLGG